MQPSKQTHISFILCFFMEVVAALVRVWEVLEVLEQEQEQGLDQLVRVLQDQSASHQMKWKPFKGYNP